MGQRFQQPPHQDDKKLMKRCCTSDVIRKKQIKTTWIYHHTSIRMSKIWNADNTKCQKSCEATGTLIHRRWRWTMVQPLWKTVWHFFSEPNIFLPYNPAIALLGIYSKELRTFVHRKSCTQMFIGDLFIITKTWK